MRRSATATITLATAFVQLAAPAHAEDAPDAAIAGLAFRPDAEYTWNWANAAVKAGDANARGWTGAGQTVAMFDTGLNAHSEFKNRIATGYDAVLGKVGVAGDYSWHGTFVAGMIGAARDGKGMEGVAYDATLMSVRIANADGSITLPDRNLAAGITYATGRAGVFNNSWNSSATLGSLSRTVVEAYYGQSIAAWRKAVASNTIVVWAAGNDAKSDVGFFAALPTWYSDLKKGWIAAVATDSKGVIASYSDRCGSAAAWCLAAPGSNVISTYGTSQYAIASGTSFAAPVISGGAAALKQEWPFLTNDQITSIMFRTANKSGIYANTAVYGQGMLDMEAATRPVGTTTIATKGSATTTGGSVLVTSSAFGTAIRSVATPQSVMVLDEYQRDYQSSLGNYVVASATPYDLVKGMSRLGAGLNRVVEGEHMSLAVAASDPVSANGLPRHVMSMDLGGGDRLSTMAGVNPVHLFGGSVAALDGDGLLAKGEGVGSAYLALAGSDASGMAWSTPLGRGLRLGAAAVHGTQADTPSEWQLADPTRDLSKAQVFGAALRGSADAGPVAIGIHGGMVRESGTVLGSASEGALALGAHADTSFAGIDFDARLAEGLSLFGGFEAGRTNVSGTVDSVIAGLSDVTSTAFHLGAAKTGVFGETDRLGLVVNQPLRVGSGTAQFTLPASRDADGVISYATSSEGFVTDGREIDLQLGYTTPAGAGQSFTAAGLLRLQPDNVRDAKPESVLMGKYRMEF